jgi:hypothetical protein
MEFILIYILLTVLCVILFTCLCGFEWEAEHAWHGNYHYPNDGKW